jgi:hypothetical protein
MILWTIQTAIISFVLIFLVHHLLIFFTDTLTVPKVKDLVYVPAQKYEQIYQTIQKSTNSNNTTISKPDSTTNIEELLPMKPDTTSMKNELKSFLKSQQNKGTTTSIDTLNSFSGNYSNF